MIHPARRASRPSGREAREVGDGVAHLVLAERGDDGLIHSLTTAIKA
jgi:hypothetical protein